MAVFTYATADQVAGLIKGGLSPDRIEMLDIKLVNLSSQLSAWYPGLRERWLAEEEDSELRNLVEAMVVEAGRKFINNPDGMSSETIGVFAYSRFDTEDPAREPFSKRDLAALEAILATDQNAQIGSFAIQSSMSMFPAAPMPGPRQYSNSVRRWGRR